MVASVEPTVTAKVHDNMRLTLNADRLHFSTARPKRRFDETPFNSYQPTSVRKREQQKRRPAKADPFVNRPGSGSMVPAFAGRRLYLWLRNIRTP